MCSQPATTTHNKYISEKCRCVFAFAECGVKLLFATLGLVKRAPGSMVVQEKSSVAIFPGTPGGRVISFLHKEVVFSGEIVDKAQLAKAGQEQRLQIDC